MIKTLFIMSTLPFSVREVTQNENASPTSPICFRYYNTGMKIQDDTLSQMGALQYGKQD